MLNLSIRYVFSGVVFAVLLGSCSFSSGAEWSRTTDITIGNYDLQSYVPVPVAGEAPVRGVAARADMEITVDWRDEEYNPLGENYRFIENTVYMSQITLTARDGFAFAATNFKYYPEDAVDTQPKDDYNTKKRALSTITYKKTADPKNISTWDLDLTSRIPAPVGGASPITSFYAGSYGGTIVWETRGSTVGVFQTGTAYTANVTLYAAPGCTLIGSVFTHTKGTVSIPSGWVNTGSTITGMRIDFPATADTGGIPPDDRDLTYKVPKPVSEGTAVTYFYTPQYTGTITWSPSDGVFLSGRTYTAAIVLRPVAGYSFTDLEAGFTHSGNQYTGVPADDGAVVVTITFPATIDSQAAVVTDLDLTDKVPSPATNGEPAASFSTPQYTGYVDWTDTSTGDGVSGLFAGGTSYTAKITLSAASGYKLDGVGANGFTYDPTWADSVSYDPDFSMVTIVFAATVPDTSPTAPVTDRDLTSRVGMPVRGWMPDTAFTADQYEGTVAWAVTNGPAHSGAFAAGTAYTATVTLKAKAPYTFDGMGVGAFTRSGALSVINETGTGETIAVTINFPATNDAVQYSGPFSGTVTATDSLIDLIRGGKGTARLNLELNAMTEGVGLSAGTDLGTGGLILDSTNSPAEVIIDGKGRTVRLTSGSGSLIAVRSGVTLTLRNITFAGKDNNGAPLLRVQNGGTLILEDGAVITGNTNISTDGGGIAVTTGGRLVMNGGAIRGNKAVNGGGLYTAGTGSAIAMSGGTISGNSAIGDANGAATGDGGGGGVFIDGGRRFEMSGNAVISGNNAGHGGGVLTQENGSTLDMSGNAEISGNTALEYGGGVYTGVGTIFTMTSGVVYGKNEGSLTNTAPHNSAAVYKSPQSSASFFIATTDYTIVK
jgi:hypothetical protein